ncbi:MAG TPA: flavin reductase family protein [Nitrososphaera sp.]|nr:flavin reductase family protein [Nitrososphaera sp.]
MQGLISEKSHRYFATTVALITTRGSRYGDNVMAAEWTMQVSYDPMIIAVFVHKSPTYLNMKEGKSFGVNIASEDQAELVNISGGYSAKELQKLRIPGAFMTYPGTTIDALMIRDCVLNAECKVVREHKVGDHIMVLGRVLAAKFDESKLPLIYTRGNYRKISPSKIPSGRIRISLPPEPFQSLEKMALGQFVLRASVCLARSDGRTLLQKFGSSWTVPFVVVRKGDNYAQALDRHLRLASPAAAGRMSGKVGRISGLVRANLVCTKQRQSIRANFVCFHCDFDSRRQGGNLEWFDKVPRGALLRQLLLQDSRTANRFGRG